MELDLLEAKFNLTVVVPVTQTDYRQLMDESRMLKISVAELIRRKAKLFSIKDRNKIVEHHKNTLTNGK